MKRAGIALTTVGLSLVCLAPAYAITWCHDYTYYAITGNNWNGLSVDQLRQTLQAKSYKHVTTLKPNTANASRFLQSHDVVIFGNAHSGLVLGNDGRINHFVQKRGAVGTMYTPAAARQEQDPNMGQPLLRRGWTLDQIRQFRHKYVENGETYYTKPPYADLPVEVWRYTVAGWKRPNPCSCPACRSERGG